MTVISREKEFLKKKNQLIDKYHSLLDKCSQRNSMKSSLMKPAILNLTRKEIPKNYEFLLNFGPLFAPTNRNLPFMDITTSTESCAIDIEYNRKENLSRNSNTKR